MTWQPWFGLACIVVALAFLLAEEHLWQRRRRRSSIVSRLVRRWRHWRAMRDLDRRMRRGDPPF